MFGSLRRRHRIATQVVVTLMVIPFLVPLIIILVMSGQGQGLAPNYLAVLTQTPILQATFNSGVIALGTVGLVYVTTMLAGFALSKLKLRGRQLIFGAILFGLSLPSIALTVPLFVTVRQLGLFNTYGAVILPLTATIVPFTLILVYGYLRGIPDEVIEAAMLDGCTSFSTLLRVVLPLSTPITAVVVVWTFLQAWSEFFLPLLFLQDRELQTLTQIPTYFITTYGSDVPKIFAALVLISIPVTVAYLLLQRFFERGLTAGSIK